MGRGSGSRGFSVSHRYVIQVPRWYSFDIVRTALWQGPMILREVDECS